VDGGELAALLVNGDQKGDPKGVLPRMGLDGGAHLMQLIEVPNVRPGKEEDVPHFTLTVELLEPGRQVIVALVVLKKGLGDLLSQGQAAQDLVYVHEGPPKKRHGWLIDTFNYPSLGLLTCKGGAFKTPHPEDSPNRKRLPVGKSLGKVKIKLL
jgi:hypothetical protein